MFSFDCPLSWNETQLFWLKNPWVFPMTPRGLDLINELRAAERFAETATRTEEKRRRGGWKREVTGKTEGSLVCCMLLYVVVLWMGQLIFCIWMYTWMYNVDSLMFILPKYTARLINMFEIKRELHMIWDYRGKFFLNIPSMLIFLWAQGLSCRYIDQLRDKAFEGVLESCAQSLRKLSWESYWSPVLTTRQSMLDIRRYH